MFNPNQKLTVRTDHPFHADRIGYFQFVGGPNGDCIVLSESKETDELGYRTLFSVGLNDCKETA